MTCPNDLDLIAHAAELARWRVQRLALWSCEVGRDQRFAALLSELTGAEVWTTDARLGSRHRGRAASGAWR